MCLTQLVFKPGHEQVQCQEHSSTIVAMEHKLIKALAESADWRERESQTQKKLTTLQQELGNGEEE